MTPPFVKKFDFRGIYNKDITDADGFYLGMALSQTLPLKKVLIGWDTRESSKSLASNFIQALKGKGIEISYMDRCPIDYVTAGSFAFDFDLSVMFTGSHNPWNWSGLLMHTQHGNSIQGETVTKIIENYTQSLQTPYLPQALDLSEFQNVTSVVEEEYAKKLQTLIPLDKIKALKVLVDIGDGSGSRSLSLLEKLLPQVTFSRINDRQLYDASSSHTADPSEIENMKELMQNMQTTKYDCGFAFDSDADRVLAVDETGKYINGSLLGSAMSEVLTSRKLPDTLFGYAVDCGPSMHNTLPSFAIPVGRSLLRKMLRDGTLDFGIENVGHFYAKDFFMTDSGVFSLAVILYWISTNGELSMIDKKYPDGFRQQIFVPVNTDGTDTGSLLYEQINKPLKEKTTEKKIEVDGIRYEFYEGKKITAWYSIRKSGYEPIEKYYFGALDEDEFAFLKKTFEEILQVKQ